MTVTDSPSSKGSTRRIRSTGRSGRYIAISLIAALTAGIAAITAAVLLIRPPEALGPIGSVSEVPVSSQAFSEEVPGELKFSIAPSSDVKAMANGMVTSSSCTAGAPVESGSSFLSVNASPVIALATSIPLWRSLALDDKGPDVAALEVELVRLGYLDSADDYFGWSTSGAISAMFAANGDSSAKDLSLERTLWLPSPKVSPLTCLIAVGDELVSGSPVATLPPVIENPVVATNTNLTFEGNRIFATENQTILVTPELTVVDVDSLAALVRLISAEGGVQGGERILSGTLRLEDPVQVSVVPPSALFGLKNNTGCVVSNDSTIRVTVVGSQLGSTYVKFPGKFPKTVSATPKAATCL